jgi:hypothetical protein
VRTVSRETHQHRQHPDVDHCFACEIQSRTNAVEKANAAGRGKGNGATHPDVAIQAAHQPIPGSERLLTPVPNVQNSPPLLGHRTPLHRDAPTSRSEMLPLAQHSLHLSRRTLPAGPRAALMYDCRENRSRTYPLCLERRRPQPVDAVPLSRDHWCDGHTRKHVRRHAGEVNGHGHARACPVVQLVTDVDPSPTFMSQPSR